MKSVGFEYLHLLLGLRELPLAELREIQAALVRGEGLFQRELPRLHRGYKRFQLGQRGFEARGLDVGGSRLGDFGIYGAKPFKKRK